MEKNLDPILICFISNKGRIIMNNNVYIQVAYGADYPKESFNPSKLYPEYRYGETFVQKHDNMIYAMVRECLIGYGLDAEHLGTPNWNPLSEYIKPGDQVLIKPNWVMHFNGSGDYQNAMECLVTHPSCLRAICDYCLIALKGTGRVIIGDAPMQDCDLPILLDRMKYNNLLDFYHSQNENVIFMDFRKYQSIFNRNKVIVDKIYQRGEGINVDIGNLSCHEHRVGKRIYQVDNYDRNETKEYHQNNKHIYSINKDVLESDVIINFCKPKSHRLAGFTAAMKNMVGIAYNKASLPHRVEGSVKEGGDAYKNSSWIKNKIDTLLDIKIKHENEHRIGLATIDRFIYGGLLILERKVCKDPYIKGIWYGNDTIWRTIVDLNFIEQYADKAGAVQNERQRKILNFGDMVIAGEHNGPCQPEPKKMGVIVMAEDAVCMDIAICKMIGFPDEKIPMVRALRAGEADYLIGKVRYDSINILSNMTQLQKCLADVDFPDGWAYKPHDTWKTIRTKQ